MREADTALAVEWFSSRISESVADWFAERDSLEKLIAVANTPLPNKVPERVDPARLRATVVLCVLNGRLQEAAALMGAHVRRDHVPPNVDSLERVSAFDAHLCQRFPEYAALRQS
ncbi:hypothetical protein [Nocardia aurea]|uniref:hypothetical protein n=1 Tax=Nocardia aurea TaxID=2144174 RepID=UPI0033B2415A